MALSLVVAGGAWADQDPSGCNANRLSLDLARDKGVIVNPDTVTYTVEVSNNPALQGDACNITDARITFQCPDANGDPGPELELAANVECPADGSICFSNNIQCLISVNPGVDAALARTEVGELGDKSEGRLHDGPNDSSFEVAKELQVDVLEPTPTPTPPACPEPSPSGSARAYGVSLDLLDNQIIAPTPDSNEENPYQLAEIPADPLLHVDLLKGEESESVGATSADMSATATVLDVFVLDQGEGDFLVTSTSVKVSSSSHADLGGATSEWECVLENVIVAGVNLGTVEEPTTVEVELPGLGTKASVQLCEVIRSGAAAGEIQPVDADPAFAGPDTVRSGVTVNGIHVRIENEETDPLQPILGSTTVDLVVSHAENEVSLPGVCEPLPHVSGEAFVVGVIADENIIDTEKTLANVKVAQVILPSGGGEEDATLAHVGPITDGTATLVESNTAFSHTEGDADAQTSSSHAQVEDLDALDPGTGPNLTADLVRAECSSADGSSTGNAFTAGLTLGGEDVCAALGLAPDTACGNEAICCTPPPNTDVCAALSLTPLCDALGVSIILNEQISDCAPEDDTCITVNAIHVRVGEAVPGGTGADVIVSSAHCDAGQP